MMVEEEQEVVVISEGHDSFRRAIGTRPPQYRLQHWREVDY